MGEPIMVNTKGQSIHIGKVCGVIHDEFKWTKSSVCHGSEWEYMLSVLIYNSGAMVFNMMHKIQCTSCSDE